MKHPTHTSSPGRLIALGEIGATHGVRGLLRFHPYDSASEPPPTGQPLFLKPGHDPGSSDLRTIVLDDARRHGTVMLLRVAGIDSIEAAEPLVGATLAMPEHDLPAPAAGEVYVYQLEGLDVVTNAGDRLGTIERSFSNGANEVLVVHDGPREILIPMIADIVQAIDLAGNRVIIEPIPGLLDV
jgi:16S rRNA processing protein RimM